MPYQEEKAKHIFQFRTEYTKGWEEQALYLKAASEKLYSDLVETNNIIEASINTGTDPGINPIYTAAGLNCLWMLSIGYSVECLIKAIILLTTSEPKVNIYNSFNVEIFGKNRPHDLDYMLKRKVPQQYKPIFIDDEASFICKMTSYITWRGKYPIPKSSANFLPWHLGPDSEKIPRDLGAARLNNDQDKRKYENIFKSIYDNLEKAKKDFGCNPSENT